MAIEENLAIEIHNLKKQYNLAKIGSGTLYCDLQSWIARIRGKEDPNRKIGQRERLVGQSFLALNGIDLKIYQGETLGIIGSNGAGKSTLLKILSQVTGPTEGNVKLYGRVASMLEVGTGFNGEMTGRENVYLNGAILGMKRKEIDAKLPEIIEFSEVSEFIDTPVKRYSSGMYVKLAFSVAAFLDSEIMIMDEVLAVGDMAFQKKCLERMRLAAKQEGRTVLYVSHNMETIQKLCDRAIVLNQGKIIFDGDVDRAIDCYLGSSSIMFSQKDYSEEEHEARYYSDLFSVDSYQLVERKIPEYKSGEKIAFRLQCTAKCDIEKLSMHFIISRGAKPIGSMLPEKLFCFPAGKHWMYFEVDTSELPEGNYSMKYVFHQMTEYGSLNRLDIISNGFSFRVIEPETDALHPVWQATTWGSVKLNHMHVEVLDE